MPPSMDDRPNFRSKGKNSLMGKIMGLNNDNCNRFVLIATFLLWCSQITLLYQTKLALPLGSDVNVVPSSEVTNAMGKLQILAEETESSKLKGLKVPRIMLKSYSKKSAINSAQESEDLVQNLATEEHSNPAGRNLKNLPSNDLFYDWYKCLNFDSQLKDYIYVYDLPSKYNTDLAESSIRWWSTQYEGEYELFDMIVRRNQSRTMDPEKATLFYVPFFSARYMLLQIQPDGDDGPDQIRSAVEETSKMWVTILTDIRENYPYFKRFNGRDHFSTNTIDHGRCQSLLYCDPKLYGEMFFLQLNGDKMVRSTHAFTARGLQALGYNYGLPLNNNYPDIPCYLSDRDILMPPIPTVTQIQKPNATERKITALFRFSKGQHHGVPIPFFNHFIRKELLELFEDRSISGWSLKSLSEWHSRLDWQSSKFCICPPGHSQWTSRPVKSIIGGCIPVNFYRDHDQPWQDEIDHSRFSLNVDADELDSLKDVIDNVLATPGRLETMQSELEKVQEAFMWGPEPTNGARAFLMRALRRRATTFLKSKAG